jgi:hypothetical protein
MIASDSQLATIRLARVARPGLGLGATGSVLGLSSAPLDASKLRLQENRLPESRVDLGEFAALQWTRTQLCRQLRALLSERPSPQPVRVGTDVTFYYDPQDRLARVTPDLYLLPGLGYDEQLRSFRVYERGLQPSLVIHLVDALISPEDGLLMHLLRLGVQDVVLYDPLWWLPSGPSSLRGRRLLTHYRRETEPSGVARFTLQPQEHPGRIHLPSHTLWLIHRGGADLRAYREATTPDVLPSESDCITLPDELPRSLA